MFVFFTAVVVLIVVLIVVVVICCFAFQVIIHVLLVPWLAILLDSSYKYLSFIPIASSISINLLLTSKYNLIMTWPTMNYRADVVHYLL